MNIADKIKHFINYGRYGLPATTPVQVFYRTAYEQPIKAAWSMELPRDINESEYLNEELIKHELARKITEEITKHMKVTKRPPLITNYKTKRVEYVAEVTILVDPTKGEGKNEDKNNRD